MLNLKSHKELIVVRSVYFGFCKAIMLHNAGINMCFRPVSRVATAQEKQLKYIFEISQNNVGIRHGTVLSSSLGKIQSKLKINSN